MKKTIITSLVAVAALGFSGTSFAGSSSSSGFLGEVSLDLSKDVDINKTTDITKTITNTLDITKTDNSINADFKAPAAGGNIGQVAYEAPAVGGDMYTVVAKAVAIQNGHVDSVYPELELVTSGGLIAGSGTGQAAAAAQAAAGNAAAQAASSSIGGASSAAGDAAAAAQAAAAGGTSGYVSQSGITTGAVSLGNVSIDLSNAATSLAVGGNYSPVVTP